MACTLIFTSFRTTLGMLTPQVILLSKPSSPKAYKAAKVANFFLPSRYKKPQMRVRKAKYQMLRRAQPLP
jgi:hypothetical protein